MPYNQSDNLSEENSKIIASEIEEELIKFDPKVFEGINKGKKQQIIRTFALTKSQTHVGPLPDPETFKQYCELIPNGGERIMAMAEKQSDHRMKIEKKVIHGQMNQSNIGQFLAFFIGIAALIASVYCITKGHDWPGSIIGIGGITGLVTAFIQGRRNQEKDLSNKDPRSKR
jgi:uncharacterized membrane protein